MSSSNYREIERKFLVKDDVSFAKLEERLLELLEVPKDFILTAKTTDEYWEVPGRGDFVRLRNSWGRTLAGQRKVLKEITVKKKDRGSNFNRLEINAAVESILDTRALLKMILGNTCGKIEKVETVWFCPEDLVVSLCDVNSMATYVEVEGKSTQQVTAWSEKIKKIARLEQEEKNLFELFIQSDEESKSG